MMFEYLLPYIYQSLLWAVLFLGYFGFYHYVLKPRGVGYTEKPVIFSFVTIVWIVVVALIWREQLTAYFKNDPGMLVTFTILFVIYIVCGLLLFSVWKKLKVYKGLENHHIEGLRMRYSYVITKALEVLCQQLCVLVIYLVTVEYFDSLELQSLALAVVFGGAHLTAVVLPHPWYANLSIMILSIIFGAIIPVIMSVLPQGIIYTYLVHYFLFYILLTPITFIILRSRGFLRSI